jgi:hypothetical protein
VDQALAPEGLGKGGSGSLVHIIHGHSAILCGKMLVGHVGGH